MAVLMLAMIYNLFKGPNILVWVALLLLPFIDEFIIVHDVLASAITYLD